MAELDERVERLIAEVLGKTKGRVPQRTYEDEPILMRASRLQQTKPPAEGEAGPPAGSVAPEVVDDQNADAARNSSAVRDSAAITGEPVVMPARYRELRRLGMSSTSYYGKPDARTFCKQGEYMADYADDAPYEGELRAYYPSYQVMDSRQLRGYFTWRAAVRQGTIPRPLTAYAFVYVYELLNQIGVASPEEGYRKLLGFWQAYRPLDDTLDAYVPRWLGDYVVYYGLDKALYPESQASDPAMLLLASGGGEDDETLFAALNACATPSLERSRFYKQYPEAMREVVCGVFRAMWAHCGKTRKRSYFEALFRGSQDYFYTMFSAAVFWVRKKHQSADYEVDPLCRYVCKDGVWTVLRYPQQRSAALGSLLHGIDARLRMAYGVPYLLAQRKPLAKYQEKLVQAEIAARQAREKAAELPRIELDLSRIRDIRRAADRIQDRLLIEPDDGEAPPLFTGGEIPTPYPAAPAPPPEPLPAVETPLGGEDSGLSSLEAAFLRCLLLGQPVEALAREQGTMPSLLADAVNDKLFDRFGDTVIDFSGDAPLVVPDYADELKGMLSL